MFRNRLAAAERKRALPRSLRMHGHPRRHDSLGVALALYLGLYCAIAAGLAFGVYDWMRPSPHATPGVAAYKAPPATVLGYAPALPRLADAAVATAAVAEPEPGAPAPPPSPPSEAQKPDAEAKKPAAEVKQAKT